MRIDKARIEEWIGYKVHFFSERKHIANGKKRPFFFVKNNVHKIFVQILIYNTKSFTPRFFDKSNEKI